MQQETNQLHSGNHLCVSLSDEPIHLTDPAAALSTVMCRWSLVYMTAHLAPNACEGTNNSMHTTSETRANRLGAGPPVSDLCY